MQRSLFITVLSLLVCLSAAAADTATAAARDILKQHQDAIIAVRLTVRVKQSDVLMQDGGEEQKIETGGTVLTPDGLTVISNDAIEQFKDWGTVIFIGGDGEEEQKEESPDVNVTEIKLLLPGGNEVPGVLVLKDADHDLAFVRPKDKPAAALPCIDVAKSGKAALLDDLITLDRFGASLNRQCRVTVGNVIATVDRPREYLVPGFKDYIGAGNPVFNADGGLVGLLTVRKAPKQKNEESDDSAQVILPAAEVAKAVEQAKAEAAKPEKTAATAAPSEAKDK